MEQVFGRDRLTFGVEEEFLLVDAEIRVAAARSDQVIAQARPELGDQIESEFYLTQLETHSEPCARRRSCAATSPAAAADPQPRTDATCASPSISARYW